MKVILASLLLLLTVHFVFAENFSAGNVRANNSRSDTIDIINTTVHFDLSNAVAGQITAHTVIRFVSLLNNVSALHLDLLKLPVDSVVDANNQLLAFDYSDSLLLKISLATPLNQNDTSSVTVYYHGHPQADASWGGFYFQPPYSFQLGVAFTSLPHNFGRTWIPCFDNFVERSLFEFYITTATGYTATCNGLLLDTTQNNGGTITWHWKLNQTIPSYLACVSVCDYAIVKTTFNGLLGTVPVWLAARPTDTTALKNSFINLQNAFNAFENKWGPYRWDKVGYSIVPFSGGAMEHATDISYPLFGVTGNTTYESIMAHELSHHWFGDLVTCSTAEDMWLNEGWAVYCEHVFAESMNGEAAYQTLVNANHAVAVHYANLKDGGYFPLSGMPQFTTYGTTTYDKGADIAHTLRSYMGDSLFFSSVKSYLQNNAFTSKNSAQFRDALENYSGLNLHSFFNDWVFNPGFPQFSIDSFTTQTNASNWKDVTVYIRQKLNHAPHYYQKVPIEITFMNADWNSTTVTVEVSGPCTVFHVSIPLNPIYAGLDLKQKISDSETDDAKTIKATGFNNFANGKMNLNVQTVTDSAFVRIEHNFIYADGFKTPHPGLHISHERYWKVDGIFPAGFDSKATVTYNGTMPSQVSLNSGAYLDDELITNSEDSLVLFYRADVAHDWQIETDVALNVQGSTTNKTGQITINHLKKGEYALGIRQWNKIDSILPTVTDSCSIVLDASQNFKIQSNEIIVYPNPANDSFFIDGKLNSAVLVEVFDSNGKKVTEKFLDKTQQHIELKTTGWMNGLYFIKVSNSDGEYTVKKIAVMK